MLKKKNIEKMLELSDDRLAAMLKLTAAAAGADVSGMKLEPKTVRKIRAVLSEVTDADLERASILLERYRRGC